jgi:galactokinase
VCKYGNFAEGDQKLKIRVNECNIDLDLDQIKMQMIDFSRCFDQSGALYVRAPGRINIIGEHIDYNGGMVLPAAIDLAISLSIGLRPDSKIVLYAIDLDDVLVCDSKEIKRQEARNWANYVLGVIAEVQKMGHDLHGFNLAFGGNIPLGAGLSSSAALCCGVAFALNELFDLGLSKIDLVLIAQRAENDFVGMPCGVMDMFASVMGRSGQVIQLDCQTLAHTYHPCDLGQYSFLLLDSCVKHQLVDGHYAQRRSECEMGLQILRETDPGLVSFKDVSLDHLVANKFKMPPVVYQRCQYVVEEKSRVTGACAALAVSDFETFGKFMFECHLGLHLLYDVCVPETNFLVDLARGHILGARQMGGGFGGCTLNLLKTNELESFSFSASQAYERVFGQPLKIYPVTLADGVSLV